MTPAGPEYQMIRTYLDWLLDVPWEKRTPDSLDPVEARRVLDEDHYDLDKVKERIVEYLAVRKLKGDMKGPILCFVGPPGVGKTSLGQSIARAMNRKFVRISLGGVRDEAEILQLSSYTEEEKVHIAKMYLIPRQREEHGLKPEQLMIDDDALRRVIAEYTREAGVRSLERQVAAIARKVAAKVATDPAYIGHVSARAGADYLGPTRFRSDGAFRLSRPGVATGLAWTEVRGDVLYIEAVLLPGGAGHLTLTGQLGSVMQESARAALSHVRQMSASLGIAPDMLSKHDVHIHVPAGAIPKDGPSAGVTIATAIVSAARGVPVRADVAMTGEITLSGLVLPIGGIREKALAARSHGIKTVILPQANTPDLLVPHDEGRWG